MFLDDLIILKAEKTTFKTVKTTMQIFNVNSDDASVKTGVLFMSEDNGECAHVYSVYILPF